MSLRRVLVAAAVVTTVLAGSAPAPAGTPGARAGTSQVIGQTSGMPAACPAYLTVVQHTTGTTPSYEVTAPGVVTSFSYESDADPGQVRALVFTKTATNSFQLVGKSAFQTVAPSTVNTFPTRIPVPAGALLGGQVSSSAMRCAYFPSSSGDEFKVGPFDPDTSSTMNTVGSYTGRWNISAVVESDADGDGYGDVTQDLCPQLKLAQAACPAPDTTISKAPKKKSTKRKATITFASTVAGSTFTCVVDKKPAVSCSSPFKKKYKLGKHAVVITATSPFGLVDPTPATVTFKVTKPKPKS